MGDQQDSQNLNRQLDFPKYSYSIFREDFVHNTPFSLFLLNQSTDRTMNFGLNAINPKDSKHTELAYQINLLSRFKQSKAILTRIRSNNSIKLHFDFGIANWRDLSYNLYLSLNLKSLSGSNIKGNVKGGVHLIGKHFQSDFKVKYNHPEQPWYTLYNRTVINYGIWRLGLVGSYSPQSNKLLRTGAVLGSEVNDQLSFYGRYERKNQRQNKTLFDAIYKINSSTKVGLQVSSDQNSSYAAEGLLEHKFKDVLVKLKVDTDLATTWLLKFKSPFFGNGISHSIGFRSHGLVQGKHQFGLRTQFVA